MDVTVVCPRTPRIYRTGVENITLNVARNLQKRGVKVQIFSTGPDPQDTTLDGVRIREFRAFAPHESYFFSLPLFFALRKTNADIIHINGYNNLVTLFALLAKKKNQKLVLYLNSSGSRSFFRKCTRKFFDQAVKMLHKRIDFVIYTFEGEYQELCHLFPEHRFAIIHQAVDKEFIKSIHVKKESNRLLFLGRLVSNKGLAHAINAFSLVKKSQPHATLAVIGDGPDKKQFMDMVDTLGLHNSVTFLGAIYERKNLVQELKRSTALILLLDFKGLPLVFLEALVAKIPIIGTTHATEEFVRKNYIVGIDNPEDYGTLSRVMSEVLAHPNDYLPHDPQVLSWEELTDKMVTIYKSL